MRYILRQCRHCHHRWERRKHETYWCPQCGHDHSLPLTQCRCKGCLDRRYVYLLQSIADAMQMPEGSVT